MDHELAERSIHELPSARGCTYVLPAADFRLGLSLARGAAEADVRSAVTHLGVTAAEIDTLCAAVVDVLDGLGPDGALDVAELRDALGDSVRSLGDEGRRRGASTTLPMALGLLQADGEVRRLPINGRLDQQRFRYARWSPGPLAGGRLDPGEARTELALRYFSWTGSASMKQFRWFSAFSAADARAATAPLGLVGLDGTDHLMLPDAAREFASFGPPAASEDCPPRLVSTVDSVHLLRRDLPELLGPGAAHFPVPGRPGKELGGQTDPACPMIVDRGRVAGLWEFDPGAGRIVWRAVEESARPDAVAAAVERTERFVVDDLGDVRASSLDSPKSREPRLAALR